jgi:hypothetical protein
VPEREREHLKEEAAKADRNDSIVEKIEDVLPHCPPPTYLADQETNAWGDTFALVKHCKKTENKVHIKIPSDFDGKWNKAQKLIRAAVRADL